MAMNVCFTTMVHSSANNTSGAFTYNFTRQVLNFSNWETLKKKKVNVKYMCVRPLTEELSKQYEFRVVALIIVIFNNLFSVF